MTNFIEKKFILDSSLNERQQRMRYATVSSVIGIGFNLILSMTKMICGILFSSISVFGDGLNNLSDCATTGITFVGFKMSEKPPDKEHPFGHARVEYISGFLVSFVISFVGFELFLSSLEKIFNPTPPQASKLMFSILLLSMVVKFWLFLFNKQIGKRIQSTAMLAVAKDSFNDIFITLGVIISNGVYSYFSINLDGYIGILIAIMVAKSGFDLAKDTLSPIIGEAPKPEFIKEIHDEILSFDKVLGIHDLMVHSYGENRYFVSVHVEFDAKMQFVVCHEIADEIERHFESRDIQIVVHSDPVVTDSLEFNQYKEMVELALKTVDDSINLHGFRYIKVEQELKFLFDVVRPSGFHLSGQELVDAIKTEISKEEGNFICIIRIDEHYNEI